MRRGAGLIAFLGPSLPAAEARRLAPCRVLPPARQGDVWRALRLRPRAIALIDGVFEAQPSVWHREILDALSERVAVFGAASMGALRAAELHRFGMIGVGAIFHAYRDGDLVDDAEVALLHADREHGYRPLTVPLVNVRHAARLAVAAGALRRAEAARLVTAAARIFYQDRTWPRVLKPLPAPTHARFQAFAAAGLPDLKAEDARACLRAAADWLRAGIPPPPLELPPAPAHARRRRLEATSARPPPLPRQLLASWARSLGLKAVDDGALEALVLRHAHRMVPDGPPPTPSRSAPPRRPAPPPRGARPSPGAAPAPSAPRPTP
jgi:hypothetical protein